MNNALPAARESGVAATGFFTFAASGLPPRFWALVPTITLTEAMKARANPEADADTRRISGSPDGVDRLGPDLDIAGAETATSGGAPRLGRRVLLSLLARRPAVPDGLPRVPDVPGPSGQSRSGLASGRPERPWPIQRFRPEERRHRNDFT